MDADKAFEMGKARGEAAASWFFDGNTTDETYRRVLQGIEDGDPEVVDALPQFSFGEWAGESCREVFPDWNTMDLGEQDTATESFIEGFAQGCDDTIERTAREAVGEESVS